MLTLLVLLTPLRASASIDCSRPLTYVVRTEFSRDESRNVASWPDRARDLGLQAGPSQIGDAGRVAAISVTGDTDAVHRFAHGLGAARVSVLAQTHPDDVTKVAHPTDELGWGPVLDRSITHLALNADELFGLTRDLDVHTFGELLALSFDDLTTSKRFSAEQVAHILQVAEQEKQRWHRAKSDLTPEQEVLDAPLEETGLDHTTISRIDTNGRYYLSLRDLVVETEAELLRAPNLGILAVKAIRDVARRHGFDLGIDPHALPPRRPVDTSRLQRPIDVLELSPLDENRLRKNGIETLRDLVQFSPRELKDFGFKRRSVEDIQNKLSLRGKMLRTPLAGADASDPIFVKRFLEKSVRTADGSIDFDSIRHRSIRILPLSQAVVKWFEWHGIEKVDEFLRRGHVSYDMHPSRVANVEFVLDLLGASDPLAK